MVLTISYKYATIQILIVPIHSSNEQSSTALSRYTNPKSRYALRPCKALDTGYAVCVRRSVVAKKSEFLSSLGILFEMFKGIVEEVRALVGNDRADEALMMVHTDKTLRQKIAELIVESLKPTCETFTLTVNYSISLAEMITAGRYNWANSNINASNIHPNRSGSVTIEVALLHFRRLISSDEAMREMDIAGYRPATIEELLAFGVAHPQEQRFHKICCLGSVWGHETGMREVAYLDGGGVGNERTLNRARFLETWFESCRFLAVRKAS